MTKNSIYKPKAFSVIHDSPKYLNTSIQDWRQSAMVKTEWSKRAKVPSSVVMRYS